jgi:phage terminase large subunit
MEIEIVAPNNFECRDYQIDAWEALTNGAKRAILCWHRGAGKDLFALNYFIWHMITNWNHPAVYLHCFPNYSQGKKAIWDSLHRTHDGDSIPYLAHFPEQIIKSRNSQELKIELVNGTIYRIMGLDGKNSQLARGMNPTNVILSEFAYMNEESWSVIQPRVIQNQGQVIFASTPNGQNHFYQMFNTAKEDKSGDYYASLISNYDTHLVTDKEIQQVRDEGKPEDFIQQEYYCSFTRGSEGSYYGKCVQKAREENRITNLAVNPNIPCFTSWDIGRGDSTAIWIFQPLDNGKINFVHYYENHGENLEHYCKYLTNWKTKNDVMWGRHFYPHDMANDEFISAYSRIETARQLGFSGDILPKASIEEGIAMVRSMFPRFVFDSIECKRGLKCLDFYRRKYNDILKCYYEEPLHDQYSHGADSMRYACHGIKHFGMGVNYMTHDKLKQLKSNAGYGPKPQQIHRPQQPFMR